MDVSNEGVIRSWLIARPVDVIVFAAGYENLTDGLGLSYMDEVKCNLGLCQTLAALQNMDLDENEVRPYFMLLSSWSVYGTLPGVKKNRNFLDEGAVDYPSNHTGIAKVWAEDVVRRICNQLEVPFSILRPTEVYGRRHYNELRDPKFWPGFVNYYVDKFVKRDPIVQIFGPNVRLDLVHVNYVSKVIRHFIENRIEGTYNVASGNKITLSELVDKIKSFHGDVESKIVYNDVLKLDNMDINSNKCLEIMPYENDKYELDSFIKDYIAVRRFEIAKQMAIEDVLSEPVTLDMTAAGAKQAFKARKARRKLVYDNIQKVAGDQFEKLDIGKIRERHAEYLGLEIDEDLLKLAKEEQEMNDTRLNLLYQDKKPPKMVEKAIAKEADRIKALPKNKKVLELEGTKKSNKKKSKPKKSKK